MLYSLMIAYSGWVRYSMWIFYVADATVDIFWGYDSVSIAFVLMNDRILAILALE